MFAVKAAHAMEAPANRFRFSGADISRRTRASWRAGLLALALAGPGAAWAAEVDLTIAATVPTTTTLTPFTYTVTVGNAQSPATTAVNAQLALPLPANLYDISIAGVVASGGAACPAPADFVGVPGGLSTGSESITAPVPVLPSNGFCTVTVQATPLSTNSYTLGGRIDPGTADTETHDETNQSWGNTATTTSMVKLKVDKTIIAGATRGPGNRWTGAYDTDITYQLTYENQSDLDLPVGAMGDTWEDWEGDWSPQALPASSTTTLVGCVGSNGTGCPLVTATDSTDGTDLNPVAIDLAGFVLKAGSSVTITYTRKFQPPRCGAAVIHDDTNWLINQGNSYITPQWQPNSSSAEGADTAGVTLNLPLAPAGECTAIGLGWDLTKTLDSVKDAQDNVKSSAAPYQVTADGDSVHFVIVIDNKNTSATPAAATPFGLWDVVKSVAGDTAVSPTFYPAGTVQQQIQIDSCEFTGTGSTCLEGVSSYPHVVQDYSTEFQKGNWDAVKVMPGQKMTIRLSTRYRVSPEVRCVNIAGQVRNELGVTVMAAPEGSAYEGDTYKEVVTEAADILPHLPRCADISTNKTVSPVDPKPGETVTFTLDYVNSTALTTANPYNAPPSLTNVSVMDRLGPNFMPQSVTCSTERGTATPPLVSLANITGADHVFSATIPRIDLGAVVRCVVTGSVTLPGSYRNVTETALDLASGLVDPYPGNNMSSVNYGVIGPIVGLSKTLVSGGTVAGGPVRYAVVVTNGGVVPADGTVISDTPPADIATYAWTCSASGGAMCPRAASGSGSAGGEPIHETVATFPVGSSLTYAISGVLSSTPSSATLTNTASAVPPGNSSCLPDYTAPPCVDSATSTLSRVNVSKRSSAGTAALTPGGSVTYTVVASNPGPAAADGAAISDPVPAGIASQSWTCSAAGGAVCPAASGSGAVEQTIASFPAQSSLTYEISAQVSTTPPATVTNRATLAPPPGGVCEQTGRVEPCVATVSNPSAMQVAIRKTSSAGTAALTPGGSVTYTVVLSNVGSIAADGTRVVDPVPDGIEALEWTCSANGGAVCPAASGSGVLDQLIADFPAGSSLSFILTGRVSAEPPPTVVNTATATPPPGGSCVSSDPVAPCAATVSNPSASGATVTPVPVDHPWMLATLLALLAVTGGGFVRRWRGRPSA